MCFQRKKHGRVQGGRLPGGCGGLLPAGGILRLLLDRPRAVPYQYARLVGRRHPFAMLDYSVVHNGEVSSYDANRRYIEMFGYQCTLLTDTEVITYLVDYLHRRQKLTLEEVANVIAAPFWSTIEQKPEPERSRLTYLRNAFSSLLLTGPFSILLGFDGGMMALNDRLKLRSMVVGEKDETVYIASEESAIRVVEPNPDRLWAPKGGEPVIVTLNGGVH